MAEAKKVYRKNKNGVTYIYLDEFFWDKEKKVGRHRMKCIGKLDTSGNEAYKASLEADLPPVISKTERLGEKMILQKVSASIGLGKVLRKTFEKEKVMLLRHWQCLKHVPETLSILWISGAGIMGLTETFHQQPHQGCCHQSIRMN